MDLKETEVEIVPVNKTKDKQSKIQIIQRFCLKLSQKAKFIILISCLQISNFFSRQFNSISQEVLTFFKGIFKETELNGITYSVIDS